MYPTFLINQEIPEINEFYSPENDINTYYRLYFIKVKNEEEIKLHLCNIEPVCSLYYFVIRENNDVILKVKEMSFYSEQKLYGTFWMESVIANIEIGKAGPEDSVRPKDISEMYSRKKEIRIYNQSEENRIENENFKYLEAENEKDSYMKELNQNHLNDGTYIYVEKDKTYIKCVNKTIDWRLEIKWSEGPMKTMYYSYLFKEENYERFKVIRD